MRCSSCHKDRQNGPTLTREMEVSEVQCVADHLPFRIARNPACATLNSMTKIKSSATRLRQDDCRGRFSYSSRSHQSLLCGIAARRRVVNRPNSSISACQALVCLVYWVANPIDANAVESHPSFWNRLCG